MYLVVVYDISSNTRRKRLSDYLKSKGLSRLQRSMFLGNPSPMTVKDVYRAIPRFIDLETDIVHIIPLIKYSIEHMKVYGKPFEEVRSVEKKEINIVYGKRIKASTITS